MPRVRELRRQLGGTDVETDRGEDTADAVSVDAAEDSCMALIEPSTMPVQSLEATEIVTSAVQGLERRQTRAEPGLD